MSLYQFSTSKMPLFPSLTWNEKSVFEKFFNLDTWNDLCIISSIAKIKLTFSRKRLCWIWKFSLFLKKDMFFNLGHSSIVVRMLSVLLKTWKPQNKCSITYIYKNKTIIDKFRISKFPNYLAIAKSSNIPSRSFNIALKIIKRVKRRRSVYEQVQCHGGSFFL